MLRRLMRVADAAGGLACLILVWLVDARMPTRPGASGTLPSSQTAGVSGAGWTSWWWSGRPLTRKEVVRALQDAGADHGAGTVAKALALAPVLGPFRAARRSLYARPKTSARSSSV